MKHPLFTLFLLTLTGVATLAQQPVPRPTAPALRTLTPAEQKQKERVEREVQREREIRAEWARKQREYEERQAEKERQRQAKKAGQPLPQRDVAKPKSAVTQPAAPAPVDMKTPAATSSVAKPAESVPVVSEPSRKEKREKRRRETEPQPAATTPAEVSTPAPTVTTSAPAKPARVRRERKAATPRTDSVSTVLTSPALSEATNLPSTAVAEQPRSQPKREFLPKGHLFDPIVLDPLEAQTYGSVLPVYYMEGNRYKGSIVPFAFGFAKPFYRKTTAPGYASEWVLDLASFTQFEVYWDADRGKQRRQIMNNDYKVSIIYNLRRGDHTWRFRVYHISSHLGDDYIYRNRITAPTPNSVNYEQLDVTYSKMVRDWRLYGGLGLTIRKAEERKPLAAQFGIWYRKSSERAARLVGGVDVKFFQQTDFRPGIHAGIGAEVGRTQNNLTFLFETYSGFRPYSQFEQQQTFWLGVGVYLNPF